MHAQLNNTSYRPCSILFRKESTIPYETCLSRATINIVNIFICKTICENENCFKHRKITRKYVTTNNCFKLLTQSSLDAPFCNGHYVFVYWQKIVFDRWTSYELFSVEVLSLFSWPWLSHCPKNVYNTISCTLYRIGRLYYTVLHPRANVLLLANVFLKWTRETKVLAKNKSTVAATNEKPFSFEVYSDSSAILNVTSRLCKCNVALK